MPVEHQKTSSKYFKAVVVQFGRQISQKFTTMHWASCKTIRHLNQNAGSSRISNSSLEVPCFDQSLKTSPHSESLGLSWVRTDRRSEFSLRQSYDTDRKWSAKLRSRLQNHEVRSRQRHRVDSASRVPGTFPVQSRVAGRRCA